MGMGLRGSATAAAMALPRERAFMVVPWQVAVPSLCDGSAIGTVMTLSWLSHGTCLERPWQCHGNDN